MKIPKPYSLVFLISLTLFVSGLTVWDFATRNNIEVVEDVRMSINPSVIPPLPPSSIIKGTPVSVPSDWYEYTTPYISFLSPKEELTERLGTEYFAFGEQILFGIRREIKDYEGVNITQEKYIELVVPPVWIEGSVVEPEWTTLKGQAILRVEQWTMTGDSTLIFYFFEDNLVTWASLWPYRNSHDGSFNTTGEMALLELLKSIIGE